MTLDMEINMIKRNFPQPTSETSSPSVNRQVVTILQVPKLHNIIKSPYKTRDLGSISMEIYLVSNI